MFGTHETKRRRKLLKILYTGNTGLRRNRGTPRKACLEHAEEDLREMGIRNIQ